MTKRVLAALLLCALLSGCGVPNGPTEPTPPPYTQPVPPTFTEPTVDPLTQAYLDAPHEFVVFRTETEATELYLPLEELLTYESRYPDLNGHWFKDQLEGEQRSIYLAYLYAVENHCTKFTMYTEGKEEEYHDIRQLVALDSPLLEQNYAASEVSIRTWPAKYTGTETEFLMPLCSLGRWQQRMVAVDQCRKIVAGIPAELTTQLEKMEYLYDYVCDHVEYITYDRSRQPEYLYDAVCEGKTNCDGYTNMLALLFRLIGVECCEVTAYPSDPDLFDPDATEPTEPQDTTPSEPETSEPETTEPEEDPNVLLGHTWVCAWVDGIPYHFDATYDDTKKEFPLEENIYFGFTDERIDLDFVCYEDMLPECTDTSLEHGYADLVVDDLDAKDNIKKIARLCQKRARSGHMETLVVIREDVSDKAIDKALDRFFNYTDDLTYVSTHGTTYGDFTLLWFTVKR